MSRSRTIGSRLQANMHSFLLHCKIAHTLFWMQSIYVVYWLTSSLIYCNASAWDCEWTVQFYINSFNLNVAIHCFGTMLKIECLEKRLDLGLARSRSRLVSVSWNCRKVLVSSRLMAKIRCLGLVLVSWNCRKVLASVSSRTKNRMSRSRKLRTHLHSRVLFMWWCA